jgi:hypothetical protein
MLRIRNLSNVFQKRTLRVVYGHTQATPYAGSLDPTLRDTSGGFRLPLNTDTSPTYPLTRSASAFALKGGLVPGTVMVKTVGESFAVHNGVAGVKAFGLLGNFVGGELDDLGDENNIGVWYGKDGVVELIRPAFNDTGLSAAYAAATPGVPVPLYAGADGRLAEAGQVAGETAADVVGHLINYTPSVITVKLAV